MSVQSKDISERCCARAEVLSVGPPLKFLEIKRVNRSTEVDIYDGATEPVVYHGRTLVAQVSVREICQAIAKYAFVSSPYPVMLSCEVHCGLVQQDMLVDIMTKAFGDALVKVPVGEHPKLVALPSPEELKGRIMVKARLFPES